MPKIPVAGMKGRFLKACKMRELPPDLQQLIAEIIYKMINFLIKMDNISTLGSNNALAKGLAGGRGRSHVENKFKIQFDNTLS